MSRYGAYLNRINALSRKYRSRVRVFPLSFFKNRLNFNFNRAKYNSSSKLYFQRFLVNPFSRYYKARAALGRVRKDKFVRRWDRKQIYIDPANRFFRKKFTDDRKRNIPARRRNIARSNIKNISKSYSNRLGN